VKVVHLYDPECGLRGIVVVDNVACGPAIGGVRMAEDVGAVEVARLARAMTLKNAAAGLPHGGGKAGIVADPSGPDKPRLVRAFAGAIRDLVDYIPGPDMGTDETCMAWIHDEIGRAVGLPRVLGGIPLDEIGATAYGLARCAEVAAPFCELELRGATVAIEGFGNVGRAAARFFAEMGVTLVAASDRRGAIADPAGIPVDELSLVKSEAGSVAAYNKAQRIDAEEIFGVECDIFIPAARPDCIRADNVSSVKARLILQGANIPITAEAETDLHERGVLNVPDFIANAGGVICAAVEHRGGSERDAFDAIAEKITRNTRAVLEQSRSRRIEPRQAAEILARERVDEATALRRG
jgi:glutamate dehydrogenase/leucine dehydrogenase